MIQPSSVLHRSPGSLLAVVLAASLFQPAFAAFKCVDADGNVYIGDSYGDRANCAEVATDANTNVMESGAAPSDTMTNLRRQLAEQISKKIDAGTYDHDPDCKFRYFTNGDPVGKGFALAAKRECLYNKHFAAEFPDYRPSYEAQDKWADHFDEERRHRSDRLDRARERAQEDYQRTLDRIQDRRTSRKLEDIERRQRDQGDILRDMERCRKYGTGC